MELAPIAGLRGYFLLSIKRWTNSHVLCHSQYPSYMAAGLPIFARADRFAIAADAQTPTGSFAAGYSRLADTGECASVDTFFVAEGEQDASGGAGGLTGDELIVEHASDFGRGVIVAPVAPRRKQCEHERGGERRSGKPGPARETAASFASRSGGRQIHDVTV